MLIPSLDAVPTHDLAVLGQLANTAIAEKSPAAAEALIRAASVELESRGFNGCPTASQPVSFALEGHDTPAGAAAPRTALISWLLAASRVFRREGRPQLADALYALMGDLHTERELIARAPYAFDLAVDGEDAFPVRSS